MSKQLLVVGAGITGSLTANLLSRSVPQGVVSVTVWDKARGAGGRMSTHRSQSQHVDMGAQYICRFMSDPDKQNTEIEQLKGTLYEELISNKILVPFQGTLEGEPKAFSKSVLCKYVAPAGINSIPKYFLKNSIAQTFFQHQIVELNVIETPKQRKVHCATSTGHEADFDAVVVSMPVPQLLALRGNMIESIDPETKSKLDSVKYSSRYALGLFFDAATAASAPDGVFNSNWSGKYFDNPIVRFASWDSLSSSPSSAENGRTLLLHSGAPFGIEHLEEDKDTVKETMVKELNKLIPGLPQATHSHMIRWRYSQVFQAYPGSPGCVVLSHDPLVVATGDGFISSNFENSTQAAYATSTLLKSELIKN